MLSPDVGINPEIKHSQTLGLDALARSSLLSVNIGDAKTLRREVKARIQNSEGFAIATLNLDHIVKLASSAAFRKAYASQDFVVVDGNPVVWMLRLAGQKVDLLAGSDLVIPLSQLAAETNSSVAFVGSTDQVLTGAALKLENEVRGLHVSLKVAPEFGFDPNSGEAISLLRRIEGSGARLCFVALGAQKQEEFAAMGRNYAPSVGFVSIGAGLDFLTGEQVRAPYWVRKMALEWVWRMMLNPRRLGPRYFKCLLIVPGMLIAALKHRLRAK